MRLNKTKHEVLRLARDHPCYQHRLGDGEQLWGEGLGGWT